MTSWCANCGRRVEEDEKFCRRCGMPQHLTGEEATTWLLSPENAPQSGKTRRVDSPTTGQAGASTGPAYVPPASSYHAPPPYPASITPVAPVGSGIRLGQWLTGGWQVYKENWALMSVASAFGALLSACSVGILAGPLLMGLFVMAIKTMRGEQPVMQDLFNWKGRFLQAFLAFLIFFVAHMGLAGLSRAGALFELVRLAFTPLLAITLTLTMSRLVERGGDVVSSINEVVKRVFSPREWFSWWLVGLVMSAITAGGFFGCGVGVLVTLPWMICSGAVAYRDAFAFDDPNRTNQ